MRKLRTYWWYRIRVGSHALVPVGVVGRARVALNRAGSRLRPGNGPRPGSAAFTRSSPARASMRRWRDSRKAATRDLVQASRTLFYDLLGPLAAEAGKPALVEMSCFTIAAAPELARIFPEARFVHAVRDGRDSGASKVDLREKDAPPDGRRLGDRLLG